MERKDIIKNLKEHNNCYVGTLDDLDLKNIESELGFKLKVREAKNCDKGYVLERKKKK